MSIAIEGAVTGGLAAVAVRGELDIRSAPDLRAWLAKALDDGVARIVIDLAGVEFMDSSGLGVLVGAHKRLARVGGRLSVVGVSTAVARLLSVTGLARVFDVRDATGATLVS
ncbi:MAG: Anti-sigma factor antagonist RsbV [Actinomycetia bacterium]|nr:Anti-sigma factor antagonist RsbV [Actinomycetes bacterium]